MGPKNHFCSILFHFGGWGEYYWTYFKTSNREITARTCNSHVVLLSPHVSCYNISAKNGLSVFISSCPMRSLIASLPLQTTPLYFTGAQKYHNINFSPPIADFLVTLNFLPDDNNYSSFQQCAFCALQQAKVYCHMIP